MFETEFDPPPKQSPKSTRARIAMWLAGMLLGTAGYASWLGYSSWTDSRLALRERNAIGTILDVHTFGKGSANHYRFSVDGRVYEGWDGAYPLTVGERVTVYLDPGDPSTNSLTDYRTESRRNSSSMRILIYLSIGLALALGIAMKSLPPSGPSESEDQSGETP
jgi:hypothetical protein